MSNEGILNQLSIGLEDTFGTGVAPTVSIPLLPSAGINTEQEAVGVEAINTLPALNKSFVKGVRKYNGQYEMNAYPEAIGYFISSAMGASSAGVVYGESVAYTHTITETVAKPSYTVEQVIGTVVERYAGFICSGFKLSGKVGEPLVFSASGMAQALATDSKITASYETNKPFDWVGVSTLSIGGNDIKAFASEFALEYKNGLEVFHGFSTNNEPSQAYVKNSEVTGSMTLFMGDSDVTDLMATSRNLTEGAIVITVEGEAIGNASANEMTITVPKAVLNKIETKLDTDYNALTIEFVGALHSSTGLITVSLTNLVTDYE